MNQLFIVVLFCSPYVHHKDRTAVVEATLLDIVVSVE